MGWAIIGRTWFKRDHTRALALLPICLRQPFLVVRARTACGLTPSLLPASAHLSHCGSMAMAGGAPAREGARMRLTRRLGAPFGEHDRR
jgi:hypothetical protein